MIRPPKSRLRGLQVGTLEGPPKKTKAKRGAEAEEDRLGPSRSSLQR